MAQKNALAVGIDLGTTFSVVAYLDDDGRPTTIPNLEGDLITPSVVLMDADSNVVGKEAVKAAPLEPHKVLQFVKREMGEPLCSTPISGERFPPEVIQSIVLEKLKRDAEAAIGPFEKAVITVPAYFTEPRRKATQDAGSLAGIEVIDIINEPTAAAIAYGVKRGFLGKRAEAMERELVLVYDLGGGTFDVTLMEIEGTSFRAIATAGDMYLGGADWDRRLVDHFAKLFEEQHQTDPREDASTLQRLLRDAEDLKRTLTAREKATLSFEHNGKGIRSEITRQEFETLTEDLLDRTRFTTKNLMQDAGIKSADLTRLLLVGGSTRMPAVYDMLQRELGIQPDRSLAADEVVAHGAAIYAGLLLENSSVSSCSVSNVNSHDLGVLGVERSTGRKRAAFLIPKNTSLPASNTRRFGTHKANQRSVMVKIIEGGDETGQGAVQIGMCRVLDLPAGLPASTPVDVTFSYAPNGRLEVTATLPNIGQSQAIDIQRDSGLDDASLKQWGSRIANGLRPLSVEDPQYDSGLRKPIESDDSISLDSSDQWGELPLELQSPSGSRE